MNKPKGTRDFLPEDMRNLLKLEEKFRKISSLYGFEEIRTPTFESTALFQRGVGDSTDIVRKEMFQVISRANMDKYAKGEYDLVKKGFTLKPEGTAGIVRSFIENKMYAQTLPARLRYISNFFRNEQPQAGRFREFTQFGLEILGSQSASTDADIITCVDHFFKSLGLKNYKIEINSIGCPKCRPAYHKTLIEFLNKNYDGLCPDCHQRMKTNPMRVLDCKNKMCQETLKDHPIILDYLCDECSDHFSKVQSILKANEVDFVINPKIVRGLDYYTKTAFEVSSTDIGAQSAVGGGGRYNNLVESLGGPETPAVGCAIGADRLMMMCQAQNIFDSEIKREAILIYPLDIKFEHEVYKLQNKLRYEGFSVSTDSITKSFKATMKYADKKNFKFIVFIGEDEINNSYYTIKNLDTGEQEKLDFNQLVNFLGEKYE